MKRYLILAGGFIGVFALSTAVGYATISVCEDIRNNIKYKRFKKKLGSLKQEQES